MQDQYNSNDCGLHAVANLTEMLFGGDPATISYDASKMRQHLYKCMVEKKLERFPKIKTDANNRSRKQSKLTWFRVRLFLGCDCRALFGPYFALL